MIHHKQINSGHLAKLFPEDQKPDDLADSMFYMMHRGTEGWSVLNLDVDTKTNISIVFSSVSFIHVYINYFNLRLIFC